MRVHHIGVIEHPFIVDVVPAHVPDKNQLRSGLPFSSNDLSRQPFNRPSTRSTSEITQIAGNRYTNPRRFRTRWGRDSFSRASLLRSFLVNGRSGSGLRRPVPDSL